MNAYSEQNSMMGLLPALWHRSHTRLLTIADREALREHYLRLDDEDRYLRFFSVAKPDWIAHYVNGIDWTDAVILGEFVHGRLIAVAELLPAGGPDTRLAELAVSVEHDWRQKGIARRLIRRALLMARMNGVEAVQLLILPENGAMLSMMRSMGATLTQETGQIVAQFDLPASLPLRTITATARRMLKQTEKALHGALHPGWFGRTT